MPDRVREIVCDVGLLDRDGMEVCAGSRRHLAGDIAFVVSGLIERERKRLDWRARKPSGETQHGARVESAAQITAYWYVGAHPQPHRFLKHGGKLFHKGAFVPRIRLQLVRWRVIEFPVTQNAHSTCGRREIMTWRHLVHVVEQRAIAHPGTPSGLIKTPVAPAPRHSGGQQGFDFGGQIKRMVVEGVVEGLDPKTVAGGEQGLIRLVPQHERKLAAELLHAMCAEFLVQVQRNLAVRARPEQMPPPFPFTSLALEVIKLAVDNDVNPFVLVRDRLIAGREVNNAQPRMTETDALIGGQPGALAVRTAMAKAVRGAL